MKGRFSLAHLFESVSSEESGMFTIVAYADERERGLSKGVSPGEFVSASSDAGLWPCASIGALSTRAADVVPYTLPAEAEAPAIIPAALEAVRREATSALPTAEAFKLETVSTAVLSAALLAAAPRPASAEAAEAACAPALTPAEPELNAEPSVREEAAYVTVPALEDVFCF